MKKKELKSADKGGMWRNLVVFDNARPNNKPKKKLRTSKNTRFSFYGFMVVIYSMHFFQNII